MNKKYFFIILMLISFSAAAFVRGDFEDLGAGARGVGMGGAACGLSDDAFGLYYNPAGLGHVRQGQIGTDYGLLWLGLDDGSNLNQSFVSIVYPMYKTSILDLAKEKKKNKVLGKKARESIMSHYKSGAKVSTDTIKEMQDADAKNEAAQGVIQKEMFVLKHWGTLGLAYRSFTLQEFYQESTVYLSFGRPATEKLAYGINVKMMSEQYTVDDYLKLSPVFDYGEKTSLSAYSVDIGVIYNIMPRLFLGVSATDINEPDFGFKEASKIPAVYRAGLAWRQKNIKWAADGIYKAGLWYGAAGFERWFNMFGLHAGINFGGRNFVSTGLGFSFNFNPIEISYAFQIPLSGIKDTGGSHRVSMIYRFGNAPKEDLEPGSLELYYSNLQDEVADLKRTLSDVSDEKRKLEEVLIEESTLRIRERIQSAKESAKQIRPAQDGPRPEAVTREKREIKHIVRQGETLQSISKKYYGDERYWNKIYEANKDDIGRGGVLKVNQVLTIIPLSYATGVSQNDTVKPVEVGVVETSVPVSKVDNVVPVVQVVPVAAPVVKKVETKEKLQAPKAAQKHIVQAGENLQSIAKKYYNDAGKWKDIYKANKNNIIGGQIAPGQEIIIP